MPKIKNFLTLGLSEAETYAVIASLSTTLQAEGGCTPQIRSFDDFAKSLYLRSIESVLNALKEAVSSDNAEKTSDNEE